MRYTDFRDSIERELRRNTNGLTWSELQQRLELPYARPCPEWTKQLQADIGLRRVKGSGKALVWQVGRQTSVGR
jgi:hypothetical protein